MTFMKQASNPFIPNGPNGLPSSTAIAAAESATTANAMSEIQKLAQEMNDRASSTAPFTTTELQELETSFRNIMKTNGGSSSNSNSNDSNNDSNNDNAKIEEQEMKEMIAKLQDLLFTKVAHLSHKDWERTGQSASTLREILLPENDSEDGLTNEFKSMFERVIKEGNWDNAIQHAQRSDTNNKPWAVLVTGVNGIRKTTSVYQSWFPLLLQEALVEPSASVKSSESSEPSEPLVLPNGHNSFFRQLDHMIATISNYNFQLLYQLTSRSHDFLNNDNNNNNDDDNDDDNNMPSKEVIQNYSNYKASIFKRYRTLSEILGVMLIRQAMDQNINVMIETSGRDVAMFHYIDTFFPAEKYNKLVLHFTINDLSFAEGSVDRRMVREMEDGVKVLMKGTHNDCDDDNDHGSGVDVRNLINVNAGGPYGSEVLKGIQEDSDAVWETILENCKSTSDDNGVDDDNKDNEKESNKVGSDWYKASIKIVANADKDWEAKAVLPNGSDGTVFTFEAPRKVG